MAKKDKAGAPVADEQKAPVESEQDVSVQDAPVADEQDANPSADTESASNDGEEKSDKDSVDQDEQPKEEAKPSDAVASDKVIVIAPKDFKLRMKNGFIIDIKKGTHSVDREIANHWYAKANGLTIFNPEA